MKTVIKWTRQLLWSCFAVAMLSSCGDCGSSFSELTIERTHRAADGPEILKGREKLENGLYRAQFLAPRGMAPSPGRFSSGDSADPFAVPPEDETAYNRPLKWKDSLVAAGVVFGENTSASYDKESEILTVTQTLDQMELVEAFFASIFICGEGKQINVRAEIFELPSLQILQLLESSQGEGEHSPERNALLEAVRKGKARLVASPSIICRSGERAKVTSTSQIIIFREPVEEDEDESDEEEKSNREELEYGTIFELDPVLGADEYTIDLNLKLDHDTAPPSEISGKEKLSKQQLLLHRKSLTLQLTLKDGNSILIGNWKPTGDPRFEKNDLGHVIFITASIQRPGGYEQAIESKKGTDKP